MKPTLRVVWVGVALLAFGTAACGGDGGNNGGNGGSGGGGPGGGGGGSGGTGAGNVAACGIASCGGDLVGTWTATSFCVPPGTTPEVPPNVMAECPGFRYGDVTIDTTGTFTFNSDRTYAIQLTVSYLSSFTFPASCLTGVSCAQLDAALKEEYAGDPDVQSIECSGSPDCTCTMAGPPMATSESGTYVTSGNTLTTTPTGETAEMVGYCVQGDTLVIRGAGASTNDPAFVARKRTSI